MKSYLSFAWKGLKAQKVTAILILTAVILSTVMTTVIGQSIGILQSMRIEQAAGLNGDRYATFYDLTKEQAEALHADRRLYDVGDWMTVGSTEMENSGLTLLMREYHDNGLARYPSTGNGNCFAGGCHTISRFGRLRRGHGFLKSICRFYGWFSAGL